MIAARRVRTADVLGLVASCVLVLVAFAPVVFGGRTLSTAGHFVWGTTGAKPFPGQHPTDVPTDIRQDIGASAWAFEPWAETNQRGYSHGEIPFWNPDIGLGAPQAANMQSAPFDPLLLPVHVDPTPATWDFALIGAFVLGAAAMYCFGRILGFQPVPAFAASAAFSASGYFFLYSNNHFSRSYDYLPVLFALVELTLRSRKTWPVFGLGLAVAGNLVLGMPEASACVLGASVVYAVVRTIGERRTQSPRAAMLRLGGGFVLGALIASPLLLLFQQYESVSFNVHKADSGTGLGVLPVTDLLTWVVPYLHTVPGQTRSFGLRNWLGAATILVALVGLAGRRETARRHGLVFGMFSVLLVLKIYDFKVINWIGHLPLIERINFVTFASPVLGFTVAVLVGLGVQVLWTRDLDVRRLAVVGLGAVVAVGVVLASPGVWSLVRHPTDSTFWKTWRRPILFSAMVGGVVVVAIIAARRWRPAVSQWLAVGAASVVVAQLFVLVPFHIYATRADPYRPPAWMPLVEEALAGEPNGRVIGLDGNLYPNTASALGLSDIRALDALYVGRYWRYVRKFIQPSVYDRFIGDPVGSVETEVLRYRENPMFDALGVRAIVTDHLLDEGDAPAVPGHVSLRLLGKEGGSYVYENTAAYPRAWIVHTVHQVSDEDAAFSYLRDHTLTGADGIIVDNFQPLDEAVVETGGSDVAALDALQPTGSGCADAADDRVAITHSSLNTIELRVQTACAGLVVLPDTYFPGWAVTVDGREATVYPTNGALRGVVVPAGTTIVRFHYHPGRFDVGLVLAGLGLAGFGGVALLARRRRRTRPAPDGAAGVRRSARAPQVLVRIGRIGRGQGWFWPIRIEPGEERSVVVNRLRSIGVAAVVVSVALGGLAAPAAAGSRAGAGANNANAKLCQKDGFRSWTRSDHTPFANVGQCVSYAAQGGTLASPVVTPQALCESFTGWFQLFSEYGVWSCVLPNNPDLFKTRATALERACTTVDHGTAVSTDGEEWDTTTCEFPV